MEERAGALLDPTIELTTGIVSAYVSNNRVQPADLAALIATTHAALTGLGGNVAPAEPAVEKPTPAQIRKSVTHDGIVSFLDGKSYKTLKRHLTGHGLTPETYRERYGLPRDYPVTAASYSEQRSSLAKNLGLGQARRKSAEAAPEPVAAEPAADTPTPKKRGRKKAKADA